MIDAANRVRPALRRFAIAAFVILLPIAAHSLWDYVEVRRLAGEIEKICAAGEPVVEREAVGMDEPAPAVERGAAEYYLAGAMLALGTNPYTVIQPIRDWLAAPAPDRAALATLTSPLEQVVDANRDAVAFADRAAPLPFTRLTAGTAYSYRAASLSALSTLISARTLRLSIAGDGDAAVDSVISNLRLRRPLADARFSFSRGNDVEAVLSLTRPSAGALHRLDAALGEEDKPDFAHQIFLRQRARYIEMIWRGQYGPDPAAPRHFTLPMRTMTERIWRPWYSHRMVELLRTWAQLDQISKLPWPEKIQAGERLRQTVPENYMQSARIGGVFVYRGLPYDMFLQSIDATPLIIDRSARIAVAVERFRLDRRELPAALADLVPKYLSAIPADPFSGQPLMFHRTNDAYTIYSVGPNLKDDSGDLTSERPAGVEVGQGPRRIRGTDVGVRVLIQITNNK